MIQFHLMSAHPLALREPEFTKCHHQLCADTHQQESRNGTCSELLRQRRLASRRHHLQATANTTQKISGDVLVVITADHGDALREHRLYTRANNVRETVIRVPLIMLSYGYALTMLPDARTTSQIDIAATILSECGMPLPTVWRGSPLQAMRKTDVMYLQQGDEIGLVDLRHPPAIWKY